MDIMNRQLGSKNMPPGDMFLCVFCASNQDYPPPPGGYYVNVDYRICISEGFGLSCLPGSYRLFFLTRKHLVPN